MDTGNYRYKMVRGIDFYEHTLGYLQRLEQVEFLAADITKISTGNGVYFSRI